LFERANPAGDNQDQAEREEYLLPTLDVDEQSVEEAPAGRCEGRACELVDEQLAPDRQRQRHQQRVGRQERTDRHRHSRAAASQHEGGQVERCDDREEPPRQRIAERVNRAQLLHLGSFPRHDLSVGLRNGRVLHEREATCDQSLLDLVDDLVDVEDDLVALERDGVLRLNLQHPLEGLLGPGC
jgi:hypothetical protein